MNALRPGGVLLTQVPVQLQQRPQLAGLLRRDPRDRDLAVGDQGPQMPGVGLVSLGVLLRPARVRGLGGLGQQRGNPRPLQLLHHEQPPRAALDRETHILTAGEPLLQPPAQRRPAGRLDPAPPHVSGHGVQIVEGDLLPVNVKPSYDGHYRDLLTLLKLLPHLACAELRGSRLMSSFCHCTAAFKRRHLAARSCRGVNGTYVFDHAGQCGLASCPAIFWTRGPGLNPVPGARSATSALAGPRGSLRGG